MATETVISVNERGVERPVLQRALRKLFSFPVLLGALLVAFNAVIMFPTFRLEPDTWWHLKLGQQILLTGHWLKADIYSFTAYGNPPLAFEWLGEVALALAYKIGALRGLHVLLFALTSTILILTYYYASLRSRNSKAAIAAAVMIIPLAGMCFTLRPQLLGYIFLLITLICLERYKQGFQKSLWILPPLFLVWVNTHGSFILGFCVVGLYWICGLVPFKSGGLTMEPWQPRQRIHLEIVLLLGCVTLPFTPFGGQAFIFPIEKALFFPQQSAHIEEWLPFNFSQWEPKVMLVLLLGFLLAQVAYRLTYRIEELFLVLFTAYLTCVHTRFVILFALVFAPVAASVLARWAPTYEPEKDKPVINAVLIVVIILAIGRGVPTRKELARRIASDLPVEAVDYMRQHSVPGPMYNDYGFGGYLLWALGPEHKVFIDGRGDFYEQAGVFSDYISVQDVHPDALAILRGYHINSCIIQRESPLATLLRASSNWKEMYKDPVSSIFVRDPLLRPEGTQSPSQVQPALHNTAASASPGARS
ncbi:MAG TPA: hypothetical protein VGW37_14915 [Terriglobia bacterium]|nr:hypothetical protein [Terriglobia bacterium]